ncbi:hypothetical protein TNCV_5087191 [Trichonephila clavipes]|nr:hypothetical protein TNCV_5087191 [Trichonephila clavipes]
MKENKLKLHFAFPAKPEWRYMQTGKPTPSPFDLSGYTRSCSSYNCHRELAPAVQKMSRRSKERAGTGKERLYPLRKSHTTQVTTSKERQGRLMSPGTLALHR